MKLVSASSCALYKMLLFVLLVSTVLGENHSQNQDFTETENAAKAIRKLLNGEVDTIKLENGNQLKIRSSEEKYGDYNGINDKTNYSFVSNSEEESIQADLLGKKESKEVKSKIIQDQEDFYILDDESIESVAKKFTMEHGFHESKIDSFTQSLKGIIKSLNN
ncbi:hypothetical protein, conserved [Plasmodium gonderi]|uniref:Secreted protein n=1 Tax=Plasmodium gonderi TaxID=77519 RepID=A0A1Y1JE79_PLAGO|nr:hypothetical protein, conserved [Plasmodium gonderi]GAW79062.1 hypothetical protein, conserved [Plasmodium gonderi]